ncbi:sigma-70 family RNA polymerase sigma factor [Niveibacterium sp. SC-1]|uniref:sigma-70 family RNA polymerase sigma factor n=1 Tax=Niveibacterium sp. SC-1 TaxID=3135646 RepID=UPI00311D9C2F
MRDPVLDRDSFPSLAEPHRRALKLHCYRMLGSAHEAEDAVQETFARAWHALDGFEGRASLKNWLYRIATNACLDALSRRARQERVLPGQLGPSTSELPPGEPDLDFPWLQPFPDIEVGELADESPGPETRYETRESIRLAFVAAVQQLPPRQRAALILADVIGWPVSEVAALLGGTVASINSVLQRARGTMRSQYGIAPGSHRPPPDEWQRRLVDRYVRAWESADLDGFVGLLKEDASYAMPPWRHWYRGREDIGRFFAEVWRLYGGFRLLPVGANLQPAFGLYALSPREPIWRAHSLQVLSLGADGIDGLTMFMKPLGPTLFDEFGLAPILHA